MKPKSTDNIESISAITLATHNMARAVRFYVALGFTIHFGGEAASFTSLCAGTGFLNLVLQPGDRRWSWWGRVIFQDADVDSIYERALPRNAIWRERYFHITDPDGHELSFATPLAGSA